MRSVKQKPYCMGSMLILWRDKIEMLSSIWRDKYPSAHPRKHSPIEKIFSTVSVIACCLSLSNLRNLLPEKQRKSSVFMDFYVLGWVAVLSLILFSSWVPAYVANPLAAYRLFDIVSYRIFFLLVKSQENPWTKDRLRRSVVIIVVNFYEAVLAFAILYLGNL